MTKFVATSFLTLLLLCQSPLAAQEMITGTLENWENSEAKIVNLHLFSGYTREIGSIDRAGNLEIPLQEDFLSLVREEMKKELEKAAENETLSLKDLQGTYSCQSGDLNFQNPETNLTGLPKQFYVMKGEKEMLGILMPVSDPSIAKWVASFGEESVSKGKYVEWVYFDEEAGVTGECYNHKFADNDTFKENHTYNLEFKEGWNMVQNEILETYEDQSGKSYPKEISWSIVNKIPEDIQWTLVPFDHRKN